MRITNYELLLAGIFLLAFGILITLYFMCDLKIENCAPTSGNPRNIVIVFPFLGGLLLIMGLGGKRHDIYTKLKCPMPPRDFIFLSVAISMGLLASLLVL